MLRAGNMPVIASGMWSVLDLEKSIPLRRSLSTGPRCQATSCVAWKVHSPSRVYSFISTFTPTPLIIHNGSHLEFSHILSPNWVRHWIPYVRKNGKACFIQVSIMFGKKDTHFNTFYPRRGIHLGFRHFEAIVLISRLGIQQIWIQHAPPPPPPPPPPQKKKKSLYAKTLRKMPPSL